MDVYGCLLIFMFFVSIYIFILLNIMFKIIPNGMPNGWSLLEGLDVEFG